MPATSVTCPSCNVALKPKTPIPDGTRIKCPKCSTLFVVKADGAEGVPPTVAAPPKVAPRPGPPKPAAAAPPAPKPAAPKPPPAVTPKPAASKPPAAPKPAAPRPAAVTPKPPPVAEDEIVEVNEDEIVEVTDAIDEEEPLEVIDDDEAPVKTGRKRGAKGSLFKRFPMWVWLTGGGVALLVILVGCTGAALLAWSMFGGGSVTKANLDKVKKDMTDDQVKAILGSPSLSADLGGVKSETWKNGDDFITIGFVNGKAISCAYEFSGGGAKLTGGGLLP